MIKKSLAAVAREFNLKMEKCLGVFLKLRLPGGDTHTLTTPLAFL